MKIYTNQAQVRMSFWENAEGINRSKELKIKRQRPGKDFRTDIRCAFVDYVDMLQKENRISENLAFKVTLK